MVKCLNCGFLAVRDELDAGKVLEATESTRAGGIHSGGVHAGSDKDWKTANVFCFAGSPAFPKPYEPGQPYVCSSGEVVPLISSEIDCPNWREWERGFTPKEHKIMEQARVFANFLLAGQRQTLYLNALLALSSVAGALFTGWNAWRPATSPPAPTIINQVQPATPTAIVQPADARGT